MKCSSFSIRRILLWACTLAMACAPALVLAQVNIEGMRQQGRADGLSGRADVGLTSRTGNVDATNLEVGARAQWQRPLRVVFLAFQGDYGWQGGEQFSNQGLMHLRYTHGLGGTFAVEVFAQSDYNKARRLDARALAGAGVRVTLVDAEHAGVAIGSSYMYEHEQVDVPIGAAHPRETDVGRWSSYLGLRWTISENAAIAATAYAQPQLDDFDDVRAIASGALETKIAGNLTLALTCRVRHDSEPPDGIESTDTRVGTRLALSF